MNQEHVILLPKISVSVRPATQADHKRLADIAKQHRAGSGFTHFMFSGEAAYQKGWIRVAEAKGEGIEGGSKIVAFTCVRHKVRVPKTMLYYILVDKDARRIGVGNLLLDDLMQQSPHRCIELSCLKDNPEALAFYAKHGFFQRGESLKGKGWHLEKTW